MKYTSTPFMIFVKQSNLLILSFFLFFTHAVFGQTTLTQTVRGVVTDVDNNRPLKGVTVMLTAQTITVTDSNGIFRFADVPLGRYTIQTSHINYETRIFPEILVEAGKEKIVNLALKESIKELPETIVRTARPVSQTSLQSITIEQTLRYAATFFDPARLATSFPGVVAANDQANNLVIRGNSPTGTQWRLEGVEIVNPNHLSNAGTFSDRPTQSGGGTNILSAQLMERADFMTGAFPSQYGNVLGGVMDVHLRKGNDQKHEFTGQAGLIGIDLSAEGPISRKNKSSYLVNYRYSFTGLLAVMGVKFGGEDIRFQDISFNLSFPTQKAGHFTVFGMGGVSSNVFKAERDTSLWKFEKDGFDIEFKNRMGALGVTHQLKLGRNSTLRTVLAVSGLETRREGYVLSKANFTRFFVQLDAFKKTRYSLSSNLTHKLNANWQLQEGIILTYQKDSVNIKNRGISLGSTEGMIIQPYASVTGRLAPRLLLQAGIHFLSYTYNQTNSLEPRASLRFSATKRTAFSFSYGLHSQLQLPQTYLSLKNSDQRNEVFPNVRLGFTKAHHFVAGFEQNLSLLGSFKVEVYYQSLYNVPIAKYDPVVSYRVLPAFSALNLLEGFTDAELVNKGTGRNYGIEVTYQRFLQNNFYALITGSLYNSTYKGQDGIERSTRFNGNHTFSLAGGKEFHRRPNRTFGVNLRILWLGGYRDSPIDPDASRSSGQTVYKATELYTIKLKDYFRPDVRIFWKRNKPHFTRTWSIDIQNLSGTKNEAYSYYDVLQRQVVQQFQLGMVPVVNYRVEF
ncbi:TonB-dependent receptor [Runella sp.]|uniref:TonB-dependent receptor n=1 Tax=Runella sp. TaxID=1960881 RepID=UPI003D11E507